MRTYISNFTQSILESIHGPWNNTPFLWIFLYTFTENVDKQQEKCITIKNEDLVNFSSHQYLNEHNFRVPWDLLLDMRLTFSINTKTLKKLSPINGPECFNFHINIKFENDDHDGQVNSYKTKLDLIPPSFLIWILWSAK